MKKFILLAVILVAAAVHGQRAFPIHGGRLTSDLNAGGHSITNLAPGFAASIGALTNAALFATPADVASSIDAILETDPVAYSVSTNALSVARAAPGVAMGVASNTFFRVILVSPGVWQHKLPGE